MLASVLHIYVFSVTILNTNYLTFVDMAKSVGWMGSSPRSLHKLLTVINSFHYFQHAKARSTF